MLRPDSSDPTASWNEKPSTEKNSSSIEHHHEVRQVAKTLAAYGGGAVSFDLALDLVLNEVVEQARSATGATGAAIALAREGEMECRATTGAAAPDLGVRVETASGLSGVCLKTGEIQYCRDTESDGRVDAHACRDLGVRSMLVVPLNDGNRPFGILEVLSSRPNAFADRDINTLQTLARRIVASKKEAEEGAESPTDVPENSNTLTENREKVPGQEQSLQPGVNSSLQPAARRNDIWTTVLVLLVILVAVVLGVVIGWRGAAKRWIAKSHVQSSVSSVANQTPKGNSVSEEKAAISEGSTRSLKVNSGAQPRTRNTVNSVDSPTGGLLVTQNGKVIYRVPPSPEPASSMGASSTRAASETSANRLIHRVEPEYPSEAREQHIQGSVVLDVQVMGDGTVGNIEILKGSPLLAEAAVHAVRQWKYQPYFVDGQPVQSQTRITINFSLPPS